MAATMHEIRSPSPPNKTEEEYSTWSQRASSSSHQMTPQKPNFKKGSKCIIPFIRLAYPQIKKKEEKNPSSKPPAMATSHHLLTSITFSSIISHYHPSNHQKKRTLRLIRLNKIPLYKDKVNNHQCSSSKQNKPNFESKIPKNQQKSPNLLLKDQQSAANGHQALKMRAG